ncbi:MAG: CHAT domain-containing tetratricopeptide repeat protein [Chloroflexota bacterium]
MTTPITVDLSADWGSLAAAIDRLNRSDPHRGLETATAWLQNEQARSCDEGIARALRAQAHARRFLGQYDEAIAQYEHVEERFSQLGLPAEAARTQLGHLTALRFKGRYQEAVDLGLQSRAYFLEIGDEFQAAKQSQNLGTVYRPMGRLRDAAKAYQSALTVLRRLGERSATADVSQNLGNVLVDLGQFDDALRHLRAAERIRRQLGLQAEVALTLLNIGILQYRRGDYGQSLHALTESRQIYEALSFDRGICMVDLEMLPTCIALNLREESSAAAESAIDGLRKLAMPYELGQALLWAGRLAEADGDLDLALARTGEARGLFAQTGNRLWEDSACLQEASLVARATDNQSGELEAEPAEAEPADQAARLPSLEEMLAGCRDATASLEQAGALDRAAFGLLVEGAMLARLGELDQAHACYERARRAAEQLNADHLSFQAYQALGELLEAAEPSEAADSYRRAIDHLEAVRSRAVSAELKVAFLTDKADVYERLVGLLIQEPTPPAIAEAFRYVERSKSRALLEDLLDHASHAPKARTKRLEKHVRELRQQLSTRYLTAYEGNAAPSGEALSRSGKSESIADLERELARASRDLELASGAGTRQRIDQIALAEKPLSAGEVLVEYYFVGGELVAFVRRGSETQLRVVADVADVEALVDKLSFQIGKCSLGTAYVMSNIETLRKGVNRCLQQLYKQMLGPIEDLLTEGDRLIVVPHGALHGLPFHAFHDGEGYLVDRYAITVAPSAAIVQACRQVARPIGERALIVGIDDPGLPSVPREVEAIGATWDSASIALGPRATSRQLRKSIGTFDVLHLATHGVFRADNPSFSSIKLADAWLTVRDLAEVARGAQLVTLSACETGVSGIMAGDEVTGLTRGLLGAGCSSVVASLWTVSDESTARLMERFYTCLRSGHAPAEALRAAMREIREQYDHPYFWAPFVVIGDGLTNGRAQAA